VLILGHKKSLTKSCIKLMAIDGGRMGDSSRGRFFVFSFSGGLDTSASEPSTISVPFNVARLLQTLLNTG